MPVIQPNLSEIQEAMPIEPGNYPGTITECATKDSSKGTPMIVPKFTVEANGNSYTRTAFIPISGKGAFNFESLLRACGFDELADKLRAGEDIAFDTDALLGVTVTLQIEADMYNGKPSDKIKGYTKA